MVIFFARRLNPAAIKHLDKERLLGLQPSGPYFLYRTGAWRALWVHLFGKIRGIKAWKSFHHPYPKECQIYTEDFVKGHVPFDPKKIRRDGLHYLTVLGYEEAFRVLLSRARKHIDPEFVETITVPAPGTTKFMGQRYPGGAKEAVFTTVISSGNTGWVDEAIKTFHLPYPFVGEVVKDADFSPVVTLSDYLLSPPEKMVAHPIYARAALFSGNPGLAAYFLSLSEGSIPEIIRSCPLFEETLIAYYRMKRNPIGYYQVSSLLAPYLCSPWPDLDIDLLLRDKEKIVKKSLGDVDILMTFSLYIGMRERKKKLYPLSALIMETLSPG